LIPSLWINRRREEEGISLEDMGGNGRLTKDEANLEVAAATDEVPPPAAFLLLLPLASGNRRPPIPVRLPP
jgi:hypothetical protein